MQTAQSDIRPECVAALPEYMRELMLYSAAAALASIPTGCTGGAHGQLSFAELEQLYEVSC